MILDPLEYAHSSRAAQERSDRLFEALLDAARALHAIDLLDRVKRTIECETPAHKATAISSWAILRLAGTRALYCPLGLDPFGEEFMVLQKHPAMIDAAPELRFLPAVSPRGTLGVIGTTPVEIGLNSADELHVEVNYFNDSRWFTTNHAMLLSATTEPHKAVISAEGWSGTKSYARNAIIARMVEAARNAATAYLAVQEVSAESRPCIAIDEQYNEAMLASGE